MFEFIYLKVTSLGEYIHGIAWLSSVRVVKCRIWFLNERNPSLLYNTILLYITNGHKNNIFYYFFRIKAEVKSLWSVYAGLLACYNGKDNKKQKSNLELILKNYLSTNCTLKLKYMKLESLVIVDKNAAVNAQSNFAHTAHHSRRITMALKIHP